MESLIGQMLFSLSIVLIVMAVITLFVKRSMGIPSVPHRSPVAIEVLAHKMLQPKRSLYVVRIADSLYVVGSSEQGLQMFAELEDEKLLRTLNEQVPEEKGSGRIVLNAANLLSRLTGSAFSKTGPRDQ